MRGEIVINEGRSLLDNMPYCDLCNKHVPKIIRYPMLNIPDLCPEHSDDIMSVFEEIIE